LVNKFTRKNPRIHDMELNGEILIHASREKVWSGLNDPEILKHCIPGCESMTSTSDTERTAHVVVKIGPVRARFVGHVKMEDIQPNQACLLRFEGSGGAAGMAKGHSQVELTDKPEGTHLRYTVNASVGGKLGQVGGRMLDGAAKQMADQFFTAFNAQMAGVPDQVTEPSVQKIEMATTTADPVPVPLLEPGKNASTSHETLRLVWFCMGALSTGFGVLIASIVF
jgi:carbon monoxide dehydrogenase subunit G